MSTEPITTITALVLCGGKGRRMGGMDKGLILLHGRPLIEHVLEAIKPQVGQVMISANRNSDRYRHYGHRIVADGLPDFQGPLAGFASGLAQLETPYLLTLPCDGPRVPGDLARRLMEALESQHAELAVAHDGIRLQPVYALLHSNLHASLSAFLEGAERRIDRWYLQHTTALADFSDRPHAFRNVNTPEERTRMEREDSLL